MHPLLPLSLILTSTHANPVWLHNLQPVSADPAILPTIVGGLQISTGTGETCGDTGGDSGDGPPVSPPVLAYGERLIMPAFDWITVGLPGHDDSGWLQINRTDKAPCDTFVMEFNAGGDANGIKGGTCEHLDTEFKVQGNCIYYAGKKGDGWYYPDADPSNSLHQSMGS